MTPNSRTIPLGWRFAAGALLCIVCLAAMEATVRALRPMPPLLVRSSIGWNAIDSPYRSSPAADPGFAHHVEQQINEFALRGRPLSPRGPGTRRVILVGDSQVEAATLPFGDIPEIRLEQLLNAKAGRPTFEVRSLAASGWGQDQQLLALRRYFEKFEADYVLMWHTPRNDFWENAFPDRSTEPIKANSLRIKPVFLLRDNSLEPFDLEPYLDRPTILNSLYLFRLPFRVLERFGKYGRGRLIRDWETLIPETSGHVSVPREQCPQTVVDQDDYTRDRTRYGFTPVSITTKETVSESRSNFSPFLDPPSARDLYLLRVTRALTNELARTAESHHAKFFVFFNNQSYKDGDSDGAHAGICIGYQGEWYRAADMPNAVRTTFAGLTLLALSSRHPDLSLDDVSVSRTDRHLSRQGNELLLHELTDLLVGPHGFFLDREDR